MTTPEAQPTSEPGDASSAAPDLTIDLARGDLATANRTFNTSLFSSIVLAIALLPLAGALSWFAPALLDIPAGEEMGTRFLLMCTCFAFLLNAAVGSNFVGGHSSIGGWIYDRRAAVPHAGQAGCTRAGAQEPRRGPIHRPGVPASLCVPAFPSTGLGSP
ncbi:MAG: hypothetical protein GX134_04375 [candidate division WS1 bacterium]|jgi:hypothetical protein|nr:hypothetical protein [candidate division WS1 bacterium]